MNIHGLEPGSLRPKETHFHFNTDDAHLKEWRNMFNNHENQTWHAKGSQGLNLPNADGDVAHYDADLQDWLYFLVGRTSSQPKGGGEEGGEGQETISETRRS